MTIEGWPDIRDALEHLGAPHWSLKTLARFASLTPDPLPVYAVSGQRARRGGRIYCESEELEAWWDRRRRVSEANPVSEPEGAPRRQAAG